MGSVNNNVNNNNHNHFAKAAKHYYTGSSETGISSVHCFEHAKLCTEMNVQKKYSLNKQVNKLLTCEMNLAQNRHLVVAVTMSTNLSIPSCQLYFT